MQLALLPGGQRPLASERDVFDRYYTPDRLARASVSVVTELLQQEATAALAAGEVPTSDTRIGGLVWEPHIGGGAFGRAVLDLTSAWLAVGDLDPEADGLSLRSDPRWAGRIAYVRRATDALTWAPEADWAIINPPFNDAQAHVEHCLRHARHVVAILRLAFVESGARIDFWRKNPAYHIWALAQRASFVAGPGTDSAAYGLFYWRSGWRGTTGFTSAWDWHNQPTLSTAGGLRARA